MISDLSPTSQMPIPPHFAPPTTNSFDSPGWTAMEQMRSGTTLATQSACAADREAEQLLKQIQSPIPISSHLERQPCEGFCDVPTEADLVRNRRLVGVVEALQEVLEGVDVSHHIT